MTLPDPGFDTETDDSQSGAEILSAELPSAKLRSVEDLLRTGTTPDSLGVKILGGAFALGLAGLFVYFGWSCAERIGAGGSESLTVFWTLLGIFAAAFYSLTWTGSPGLAAWITMPLSDRQLVLRQTQTDRAVAAVLAVAAALFGVGFGVSAQFGPISWLDAVVGPCLVTAAALPLALLFVRLGRPASCLALAAALIGWILFALAWATARPEVWHPDAWRPQLFVGLAIAAIVGWSFLDRLPGRERLRRLADPAGETGKPAEQTRTEPFEERELAIAALLLLEPRPRRRTRRATWTVPVAALAGATATWWLAKDVPIAPVMLPQWLAVAVSWMVIHGRTKTAESMREPQLEVDDLTRHRGSMWGFSVDPLPIRPSEVVAVGLRYRAAVALGLAVVALAPALVVNSVELQVSAMLLASFPVAVMLVSCAGDLFRVSAEREPPKLIPRSAQTVGIVIGAVLGVVLWWLTEGSGASWVSDTLSIGGAFSRESVLLRLEQVSTWIHSVDVRIYVACFCCGLVALAASNLRRAFLDRQERTTDVWP